MHHDRFQPKLEGLLEPVETDSGGSALSLLKVHNPAFYGRVLAHGSLGLGESYMDGWWDTDALDVLVAKIKHADLEQKVSDSWRLKLLGAQALIFNRQSIDRAHRSIAAHYDIGNDLYERMLDPRMVYTCAYWKDATDLASAQEAKLDLVCRKVGLRPGMRVLDLGCGWGGFALYAAEKYGCSVVGVTVSRAQAELAGAAAEREAAR